MKAYFKSCAGCRSVGGLTFVSSCETRLRGKVWNFRWLQGVKLENPSGFIHERYNSQFEFQCWSCQSRFQRVHLAGTTRKATRRVTALEYDELKVK
jgi:hypothetical protein